MDKMIDIPIYNQTGMYAREHGELDQFRNSNVANIACRNAIEEAIRANFDGLHLRHDAALPVIQEFGAERVMRVLANTIQMKAWDGRFSRENKAWAATFSIPADVVMGMDRRTQFIVNSHPAVLDGFIHLVRQEAIEQAHASVRGRLNKTSPAKQRSAPLHRKEAER